MNKYFLSSIRLHEFLRKKYWDGNTLLGPTLGNKYYRRSFRILRSYIPSISREKEILSQGLGYWIISNWKLFDCTSVSKYKRIALACSNFILNSQSEEGNWPYPQKLIKCKINTNNGTWASLGLLETYRRTGEQKYLVSALKWYNLLVNVIGFQKYKDSQAINYAQPERGIVPNNTTFVLRFLAELSELTGDRKYLQNANKMIKFLELTQMKSGEIVYSVETPHYLCFQYNSFEFLDLLEFYRLTSDKTIFQIIRNLIKFISSGVNDDGSVKFNCSKKHPTVIYYASAVGCALLQATKIGLGDFSELEEKVYKYVLSTQKLDGGFPYSRNEYCVFSDQTTYPYINAYLLDHLIIKAEDTKLL